MFPGPGPVVIDDATGDVWGSVISGSYGNVFRLSKQQTGGKRSYDTIDPFQGGTDGNLNSISPPVILQGSVAYGIAAATDDVAGQNFTALRTTGLAGRKHSAQPSRTSRRYRPPA